MLTPEQKKQKQRLIRYVIIFCVLLIPLLGYLQQNLLKGDLNLPLSSTILVFALININGLLLLLMVYLVLRNLVELIFERNQKILGSKLRTRLVVSFIALSLVPTALLFFIALRFVSTSMDYWFNSNVEASLEASLKLAQSIFQDTEKRTERLGIQLSELLENKTVKIDDIEGLEKLFQRTLAIAPPGAPDSISILDDTGQIILAHRGPRLTSISLPAVPSEAMRQAANKNAPEIISLNTGLGELILAINPLHLPEHYRQPAFLVTSLLIPKIKLERMQTVSEGITGYRQLIILKAPIKLSLIIIMLIITLLILFGAIWFGFYIARSLTGPINKLALATRRISDGDLNFILEKESDDEMGMLVDSFNSMTADLNTSNKELAAAHNALKDNNIVSEQQRQYLETILENVAAGVIALDENNKVTTINRFAEELLYIKPQKLIGKKFHKFLPKSHVTLVESFLQELLETGKHSIERHLRVTIRRGETLSLQVNITRMVDKEGSPIGFVIVFDNLTKLEKAQRLAAWQEVARRIAHEIKNPLTPIQLSAQRLRKRYMDSIDSDRDIFDQCTATIVTQVEEIKRLVSEFSDFARMPKINKTKTDICRMVEQIFVLYKEAHKHITFTLEQEDNLPEFSFDPIQIKRVVINLLDNAVSVQQSGGNISLKISASSSFQQSILISVIDEGPGISEEVKMRLFEPYFSTRKSGTGLGLAIAHTIIAEHSGSIKVRDNKPTGSIFTVELPLET